MSIALIVIGEEINKQPEGPIKDLLQEIFLKIDKYEKIDDLEAEADSNTCPGCDGINCTCLDDDDYQEWLNSLPNG